MAGRQRHPPGPAPVPGPRAQPGPALAAFRDGLAAHQAGDLQEAARRYGTALAIDPRHADSLHLLGVVMYQAGQPDPAARLIGQAIAVDGGVAAYHANLGNALRDLGETGAALASYRRAIDLDPALAAPHCNLGALLLRLDRIGEATACFQRAIQLDPALPDAHAALGAIRLAEGRLDDAVAGLRRALEIEPRLADVQHRLGHALRLMGRLREAETCFRRALELDPGSAEACNSLGFTLQATGDSEQAIGWYRRALELDPACAEAANNLGNALKDCGRFDEALASYDRALALRPDYAAAHFNRADLKTFEPRDPDLPVLERLVQDSDAFAPAEAALARFALAKALDDAGDHERGFEQLLVANRSRRAGLNYDEPAMARYFERIRTVFDQRFLAGGDGAGHPSEVPVFVVGMPRSGSTLVEQLLASHPAVRSAGERDLLERIAQSALARAAAGYPETILDASDAELRRIAGAYLDALPALLPGQSRIVDKLPGNFFHVGLIRKLLPRARIIHVARDPLDTCLSCFSKHFSAGHEYSYDLAELGRYYRRYRELMRHWRGLVPEEFLCEVRYESLVADFEGQARRLVAFCGLPWDAACLQFHRAGRVVRTASAVQVRRPVSTAAVGRAARLAPRLGPLVEALQA